MAGGYDERSKRDRYDQLFSTLWTERTSGFDGHWRELGDHLQPRRTRFWTGDKNRGDQRNTCSNADSGAELANNAIDNIERVFHPNRGDIGIGLGKCVEHFSLICIRGSFIG